LFRLEVCRHRAILPARTEKGTFPLFPKDRRK
jgi:hypothetical protein